MGAAGRARTLLLASLLLGVVLALAKQEEKQRVCATPRRDLIFLAEGLPLHVCTVREDSTRGARAAALGTHIDTMLSRPCDETLAIASISGAQGNTRDELELDGEGIGEGAGEQRDEGERASSREVMLLEAAPSGTSDVAEGEQENVRGVGALQGRGHWKAASGLLLSGFIWDFFNDDTATTSSSWDELPFRVRAEQLSELERTEDLEELEVEQAFAEAEQEELEAEDAPEPQVNTMCRRKLLVNELLGRCPVLPAKALAPRSHIALAAAALEQIAEDNVAEEGEEEDAILISPRLVWTEQVLERVANATAETKPKNASVVPEIQPRITATLEDSKEEDDEDGLPGVEASDDTWKFRFNYASEECGANILSDSNAMKGAPNVLRSSKDAYVLAPCAEEKWLVLELCEEINVEVVVVSNMEFFSSSFKEFDVYHSDAYPAKEWTLLASFTAENVRVEQRFPVARPAVTKYLKFVFREHYGKEFYCPVTSVKVFGSTLVEGLKEHLEADSHTTETIHQILAHPEEPATIPVTDSAQGFETRLFGNYEEYCENTNLLSSMSEDKTLLAVSQHLGEGMKPTGSPAEKTGDEESVNVFTQLARRLSKQEVGHSLLSGYMDDFVEKISLRFNELKMNATRTRKKDQATIKILSNVTSVLLEENQMQRQELEQISLRLGSFLEQYSQERQELASSLEKEKRQNLLTTVFFCSASVVVSICGTIAVLSVLAHLQRARLKKSPRKRRHKRRFSSRYSPPASPDFLRNQCAADTSTPPQKGTASASLDPLAPSPAKREGKASLEALSFPNLSTLGLQRPPEGSLSARSLSSTGL